ncbi:hypothetical protein [Nocardiopsis synnemataformans]|uniref:hypothetical protein n=1 Tax=Nocardiopsis synnemataformans TaxID=61305 RepID=UPI003EB99A87
MTSEQTTALTALAHRFAIALTGEPAHDITATVNALMDALDTTTGTGCTATLADIHHGLALVDDHTAYLNERTTAARPPDRHRQLNENEYAHYALQHIHLALCANHHPAPDPTPTIQQALAYVRAHVIDTHTDPAALAFDAICATAAALPTLGAHPHFGPDDTTLKHVLALTEYALHHAHRTRHTQHLRVYGRATNTATLRIRFERRKTLPAPSHDHTTIHRHVATLQQHLRTLTHTDHEGTPQ